MFSLKFSVIVDDHSAVLMVLHYIDIKKQEFIALMKVS